MYLWTTPLTILVLTIRRYWCSTSFLSHRLKLKYLPRDIKIKAQTNVKIYPCSQIYVYKKCSLSTKYVKRVIILNLSFWCSSLDHSNVKCIREINCFNTPLFHYLLLLVLTFLFVLACYVSPKSHIIWYSINFAKYKNFSGL